MQNLTTISWNIDNGAGFAPGRPHSKNMKILFPEYESKNRINNIIKRIKNIDIVLIQEAVTSMNGFNTVEYIRKAFIGTHYVRITSYNPFSDGGSTYIALVKRNIGLTIDVVTVKQEREDTKKEFVYYMTADRMPYDTRDKNNVRGSFARQYMCNGKDWFRVVQIVKVKYNKKVFYLLNTHMDIQKRSRYAQYYALKDLLLNFTKENKKFIVSGDFNAMHETIEEKRIGINSLININWKRCNNANIPTFKCNHFDLIFYLTQFLFPQAYKNFCKSETKENMLKYYNSMVNQIKTNNYEIKNIDKLVNIRKDLRETAIKCIEEKTYTNWPNMPSTLDVIFTNMKYDNVKVLPYVKGTSDHFPLSIDLLV